MVPDIQKKSKQVEYFRALHVLQYLNVRKHFHFSPCETDFRTQIHRYKVQASHCKHNGSAYSADVECQNIIYYFTALVVFPFSYRLAFYYQSTVHLLSDRNQLNCHFVCFGFTIILPIFSRIQSVIPLFNFQLNI